MSANKATPTTMPLSEAALIAELEDLPLRSDCEGMGDGTGEGLLVSTTIVMLDVSTFALTLEETDEV